VGVTAKGAKAEEGKREARRSGIHREGAKSAKAEKSGKAASRRLAAFWKGVRHGIRE
jgi:hypothetical protein